MRRFQCLFDHQKLELLLRLSFFLVHVMLCAALFKSTSRINTGNQQHVSYDSVKLIKVFLCLQPNTSISSHHLIHKQTVLALLKGTKSNVILQRLQLLLVLS